MDLLMAFALFATLGDASPATTKASTPEQAVIVQFDYGNKAWAPFVTHTERDEDIRIISIRKATKHEARYYFSQIFDRPS